MLKPILVIPFSTLQCSQALILPISIPHSVFLTPNFPHQMAMFPTLNPTTSAPHSPLLATYCCLFSNSPFHQSLFPFLELTFVNSGCGIENHLYLQETGLGKLVNGFRKRDTEIGARARELVARWKNQVADEASTSKKKGSSRRSPTPPPSPSPERSPSPSPERSRSPSPEPSRSPSPEQSRSPSPEPEREPEHDSGRLTYTLLPVTSQTVFLSACLSVCFLEHNS